MTLKTDFDLLNANWLQKHVRGCEMVFFKKELHFPCASSAAWTHPLLTWSAFCFAVICFCPASERGAVIRSGHTSPCGTAARFPHLRSRREKTDSSVSSCWVGGNMSAGFSDP